MSEETNLENASPDDPTPEEREAATPAADEGQESAAAADSPADESGGDDDAAPELTEEQQRIEQIARDQNERYLATIIEATVRGIAKMRPEVPDSTEKWEETERTGVPGSKVRAIARVRNAAEAYLQSGGEQERVASMRALTIAVRDAAAINAMSEPRG